MVWDFSTEPEFAAQLDRARTLLEEEIYPLEVLDLDHATFRRLTAPLQDRVKARGLWAAHLDPALGGQGFGQLKLGLLHEVHRVSVARRLLRDRTPSEVPTEHVPARRAAALARFAEALEHPSQAAVLETTP